MARPSLSARAGREPLGRHRAIRRHMNKYLKRYRERHRAQINARARARYAANKEKEHARQKVYRNENREWLRERSRTIYEANPIRRVKKAALEKTEKFLNMRRNYREKNPRTEYNRSYESNYRARRRELHNEKHASDPQYRLRRSLRARLRIALKNNQREGSAIRDLGCSIAEFRTWLEKMFEPGMTWENYGRLDSSGRTWQIDHINPLYGFDLTDPRQVKAACHFTNLRPLWALDNRRKGNKLPKLKGGAKCPLTKDGPELLALGA